MRGEDHLVEGLGMVVPGDHRDSVFTSQDTLDRRVQADTIAERLDQLADILLRATDDGLPLRTIADRHQAVVIAEAKEELRGEVEDLLWISRPNGGGHRQEVLFQEHGADATTLKKLSDRFSFSNGLLLDGFGPQAIEPQDISQHGPVAERGHVLPAGEKASKAAPLVFEAGLLAANAEAHVAVLRVDLQHIQQATEVRIGSIVENHEPGIDVVGLIVDQASDRVTVPAWIAGGFEESNVVIVVQQTSYQVATDPTTNHRDPLTIHDKLSSW